MSHAMRPIIPRTSDAIALPPPEFWFVVFILFGVGF
jgi:hypothetical protein